jgi:hypothetical protein
VLNAIEPLPVSPSTCMFAPLLLLVLSVA